MIEGEMKDIIKIRRKERKGKERWEQKEQDVQKGDEEQRTRGAN